MVEPERRRLKCKSKGDKREVKVTEEWLGQIAIMTSNLSTQREEWPSWCPYDVTRFYSHTLIPRLPGRKRKCMIQKHSSGVI